MTVVPQQGRIGGLFRSRRLRQIGSLYVSMIMVIVIGLVTSVINTRMLGPERYGDLKFIYGVFQFLATISTLGIFSTGSQLLATTKEGDDRREQIIGALLVNAAVIAAIFIGIAVIFSFVEPALFGNDLGLMILTFSPTIAVFIFQPCIENILQGENRIHELSLFRILPGALFALSLVVLNLIFKVDLVVTLLLQFASGLAVNLMIQRRLRPSMSRVRELTRELWKANIHYGRQVYFGVLSGVATAYLSTFMISYFLDNTSVGYFALAMTLTMPLMQVSTVVGTSYFRDFAHSDRIPRKVTLVTVAISAGTLIMFLLLVKTVVVLVYTERFAPVAELSAIIATGSVFHGFGDYINKFLGAHGRGKELRNGAIAVGIINVAGYYLLVRWFGVEGAAVTKLAAGVIYCGMMILYYVRFRREVTAGPATAISSAAIEVPTSESV